MGCCLEDSEIIEVFDYEWNRLDLQDDEELEKYKKELEDIGC